MIITEVSYLPTGRPSAKPTNPTSAPSSQPSTIAPTNIVVGHWTTVASAGIYPWRQQHASVINPVTGLIYTIGGWAGGAKYLSDVWVFNTNSGKLASLYIHFYVT